MITTESGFFFYFNKMSCNVCKYIFFSLYQMLYPSQTLIPDGPSMNKRSEKNYCKMYMVLSYQLSELLYNWFGSIENSEKTPIRPFHIKSGLNPWYSSQFPFQVPSLSLSQVAISIPDLYQFLAQFYFQITYQARTLYSLQFLYEITRF